MNLLKFLSFFGAMSSADLLAATKLKPEELQEQLESHLESEELEMHTSAIGARFWRLPGSNEISPEKAARLLEIAAKIEGGFTPSSLHREQLLSLGLAREQIKALVDKWHHEHVLKAIGEKRVMGKSWTLYGVANIEYSTDDDEMEVFRQIIRERGPIAPAALAKASGRSRYKTAAVIDMLVEKKIIGKEGSGYVTL